MTSHADQSYERGPNAAHGHDNHEQHGGVGIYLAVAVALVFLTACSYWTYTPLWPFGHDPDSIGVKRVWMMAVSCTKAMLVILFFMHLKWEANWKWVLTVPASLMSLLLILALIPDVGMRFDHTWHSGPSRQRVVFSAERPADDPPPLGEQIWNNKPAGSHTEAAH
jgi:cytochrome c oxidase subunit 4